MKWEKNFPVIECEQIISIEAKGSPLMGESDARFKIKLHGICNADELFEYLLSCGYGQEEKK